MKNNKYAFVIPAYNPDEHLIEVIRQIREKSKYRIFVIDDGSRENTQHIFDTIEKEFHNSGLTLLRHAVNLGKGAALKTVFNYILVGKSDEIHPIPQNPSIS